MRRRSSQKSGLLLALIFGTIVVSSPIFAAEIVIDGSADNVYGNSDDGNGTNGNGAPTDNTVHITENGNVTGNVSGGASTTQDVSGNEVTVDDGAVVGDNDTDKVYGGDAGGDKAALDNHVVINGSDKTVIIVQGDIYGGNSSGAGEVGGNSVTLNGGKVNSSIYGGNGGDGSVVSGNGVTLGSAESYVQGAVFGGNGGDGSVVSGNWVTIINGQVQGTYISGGSGGDSSTVSDNTVSILSNDSRVGQKRVYGGEGGADAVISGNRVLLGGDAVVDRVYGGSGDRSAEVKDNHVVMEGKSHVTNGGAYGGSGGLLVTGNSVTLNDEVWVQTEVYGGEAAVDGEANNNSVAAHGNGNGILLYSDVYGGMGDKVNGNTVTMDGAVMVDGADVYGGSAFYGDANGNSVSLSDNVTLKNGGSVYGGSGWDGDVNDNEVIINGNTLVDGDVYGGQGLGGNGAVRGNSVTMNGGTIGGNVYGGQGEEDADVTGNEVVINSGEIGAGSAIFGGKADEGGATGNSILLNTASANMLGRLTGGEGSAEANENSVTLHNGNVNSIWGGFSDSGDARGNYVTVLGGTVANTTYGGNTFNGAAADNTVEIGGGEFGGDIIGGMSSGGAATGNEVIFSDAVMTGGSASKLVGGMGDADATGNTVTIMGTVDLTDVLVSGGSGGAGYDAFTGNTLNLKTQASIGQLNNFEYLNFHVPAAVAEAGGALLTVTGTADLTGDAGRSSVVNVGIDGNSSVLKAGDSVLLIDAGRLVTNPDLNETAEGYGKQGSTLDYTFDIVVDSANNDLLANVRAVKTNTGSKALSEGFFSSLALAAQGADLAAGEGLGNAMSATATPGIGFNTFAAISGSSLRYNTGSHVDVDSLSLMAGIARGFDLGGGGRLTLGAFFEYGTGSFDTFNDFADGEGDLDSVGGGVLGRVDFADSGSGHFYTEASARIGRIDNEFGSDDLFGVGGLNARYDASSSYYSLHAGIGYAWCFGSTVFDMYGKYFWTRQGGDSVKLSTGDPVVFEDVDSHRLRAGVRLTFNRDGSFAPYVGAAYEHEFDSRARATTYGLPIDAPDVRGGTGIGEIGFTFRPSPASPFSLDLGLRGYVGARENVAGSLRFGIDF